MTRQYFEKIGKDSTTKTIFFKGDGTHLQESGAIVISRLFVNSIVAQNIMPLCSLVKESPCNPTSNKELIDASEKYQNSVSYSSVKRALSIDAGGAQNFTVNVLTLSGKSVYSRIFNLQSTRANIEIPLHNLSRGTYCVKSEYDGISKVNLINVMR